MTVTVKEENGSLNASVSYSSVKGEDENGQPKNPSLPPSEDKEFNNFVVAPVKTKFDFSKALAGRKLQDDEFTFVLKDESGNVIQTKKNKANGVIAFDDLTFTKAQVGTHNYTVEEVIPADKEAGMTYDTMKADFLCR